MKPTPQPVACAADHVCHCGTGAVTPHFIGQQGCLRRMEPAPEPFGIDPDDGHPRWIVEGQVITEYTMRQQRGYSQHPCGCWSSWNASENSITA